MSKRARAFIAVTIASGAALVAGCLAASGAAAHSSAYFAFLSLALLASAMKVRLPGMTGTISVNFLFVLVAIAVFTFSETVLMAMFACVIQCFWKARKRPRLVQVSFNVAALALSSGAAYRLAHVFAGAISPALGVLLAVAACVYFVSNTLLVSGVLALVQGQSMFAIWKQCYFWSFPYYLAGAGIAAAVVNTGRNAGWVASLAILPSMYLVYRFYRIWVERFGRQEAAG
jgi:hypothetical protein